MITIILPEWLTWVLLVALAVNTVASFAQSYVARKNHEASWKLTARLIEDRLRRETPRD